MKIINSVALKYLLLVISSAFLSLPEIKMLALAGKTQGKTNGILGATAGRKLQCFAVSDFVEFESHYSYHELNVQNMCEYVLLNRRESAQYFSF